MKALVLVDIQNDFLADGALAVPNGDAIIPVVNKLQSGFGLVLATQDWHPAGHESFASSHAGTQPFEQIDLHGLSQTLWPDHCVQGTKGAEFSPELDMDRVEAIFRKGMESETDSYSGFFDNGKRKATGMGAYLKGRGVDEISIVGLAGDFCVYFTAMDALDLGFKVNLIVDATRPIDEKQFRVALSNFEKQGGKVVYAG